MISDLGRIQDTRYNQCIKCGEILHEQTAEQPADQFLMKPRRSARAELGATGHRHTPSKMGITARAEMRVPVAEPYLPTGLSQGNVSDPRALSLTEQYLHKLPRQRASTNSNPTMRVRSLLVTLLAGLLVTRNIEAWGTAVQAHSMRVAVPSPSSPLSGVSSSRTRAVTRWDDHLDLARREHRRKNWGQVRLLCTRVINIADDWNAVEQAHLRLALAEQNDKQVDAARRVFQVRGKNPTVLLICVSILI